ncbi:hypothetical protein [Streptomyces odontomachi]|uniref:hypothetical protein n=1 Tax=Streptomyces odontomachi TaxID=2944940 RepID=UPI00210A37A4|nr:hypothetical protein [Streptomyces sp. ODS25]
MTDTEAEWIRVPVGADAARWSTRSRCRTVLLVVHNVTSATRLLDVLPLFRDDLRVQLLATSTGSSPFQHGVPELLTRVGVPVLPWEQALRTPVNLAISASFGGQLNALPGKLIVLSHGAGYNKRLSHRGTQGDTGGHRGTQGDTAVPAPVFGLSREWLLADGAPIADAMVLSHDEQLDRLRAACPEAAHTAVLAGDPCYDRILAALPHRERFRRALGVTEGQRLVLLNSTWNPESLFGDGGRDNTPEGTDAPDDVLPHLLPRLTAELPVDTHRLAAVLHPNIWHGHGPGQVRTWLDRSRRAGLTLVDPLTEWCQALIAADAVIGDFGSVSYYAAALGTPVLLGAAPLTVLGTDSPVADFIRQAPRLDPCAPLPPQLDALVEQHRPLPGPARLTSSVPGRSAALLRRACYRLVGIAEPDEPALLDPLPLPPYRPPRRTAPLRVLTRLLAAGDIAVTRHADPRYEPPGEGAVHTAVHEDTLDPGRLAQADVILQYAAADDPRLGPPEEWAARTLQRWPHCALAAYVTSPATCTAALRDGRTVRLTGSARGADPAAYAAALHAWLAGGKSLDELCASGLTVRTGQVAHRVTVSPPE